MVIESRANKAADEFSGTRNPIHLPSMQFLVAHGLNAKRSNARTHL